MRDPADERVKRCIVGSATVDVAGIRFVIDEQVIAVGKDRRIAAVDYRFVTAVYVVHLDDPFIPDRSCQTLAPVCAHTR